MKRTLPQRPLLDQLRRQAKDLLKQLLQHDPNALERLREVCSEFRNASDETIANTKLALNHAQRVIASEYGFDSWPKLKQHVESLAREPKPLSHVDLLTLQYKGIVELLPKNFRIIDLLHAMSDSLLDAHGKKEAWAHVVLNNWSPTLVGKSRGEIFDSELGAENSRDSVARYFGFESWGNIGHAGDLTLEAGFEEAVDAIVSGKTEQLKAMLNDRPKLVRQRSRWGHHCTLLHYVAANGVEIHRQSVPLNAVEIATLLLKAGADPDALAENYGGGPNQTTLSLLITSGHPHDAGLVDPLIELLVEHGARVDGVEGGGQPLQVTLDFGYTKTAQTLARLGAKVFDIAQAAGVGSHVELRRLLQQEPDQKELDNALYLASRNGQVECLKPLIDAGADVNAPGWFGGPALHWAAINGYESVVKFLVNQGADPNIRDERFHAHAASWANENGHSETRDWLLDNSCKASIVEAAAFGRIDLVVEWLKRDPESVNASEGRTPLHEAAGRGNLKLLKLLLEHGANREAKDENGLTPLEWARQGNNEAIVQLLDARG